MKRKVIQIADSTQLISLPRKWALQHNIKKGDELDVEEQGNKIIVGTDKGFKIEKAQLNISDLGVMTKRCVHALYKKGIDEINLVFDKPEDIEIIQNALGKEAVGFEVTGQGSNYCVIKHVSGELEDFDTILRRTFLLLISLANESLDAIKKNEFNRLRSIALLEEANNRFTTTCRRLLNKRGYKDLKKTGAIYYILEDMENLADQYKYLCNYIYDKRNKKIKISKDVLSVYENVNEMLKNFYELFYKFDKHKLVKQGEERKLLVDKFYKLLEASSNPTDSIVLHHLFTIMQKIFCFVGPYLVITL